MVSWGQMSIRLKLVVAVGLLLLVVIGLIFSVHGKQTNTPTTQTLTTSSQQGTPSTPDLTEAIKGDDNPYFSYKVTGTTSPLSNWYVVKVVTTSTANGNTFNQVALVHRLSDGTLSVVAGPDTSFPVSYLKYIGAPQAVIDAMPTYQQ